MPFNPNTVLAANFDKGDPLGPMHGHEANASTPLGASGFKPSSIIEIDDDQANAIARSVGVTARELRRANKEAVAIASNEDSVVALYFYDSVFFLTTLITTGGAR